jgi:hypothetical protein
MAGCVRISKYPWFKAYFGWCSGDTLKPYVATVFVILQSLDRVKWSSMALTWLLEYQGGNSEWAWSNPVPCRVSIDSFLLLWLLTHSSLTTISVLLQLKNREKWLAPRYIHRVEYPVEYYQWLCSNRLSTCVVMHIFLLLWPLTMSILVRLYCLIQSQTREKSLPLP